MKEYQVSFFSGSRSPKMRQYLKKESEWSVVARNIWEAKRKAVDWLYLVGLPYQWPVITGVKQEEKT